MNTNTVESEVDWKAAYQFEHEEHKKTLLILDKAMEESIQVFLNIFQNNALNILNQTEENSGGLRYE